MAEETKPENAEVEEAKPAKSKKLVFILLGALVIGGGGGAAAVFFMKGEEPASQESAETVTEEPATTAGLVPMDTFLVNLDDAGGDRYMKLTLRMTIAPEAVADSLKDNDLLRAKMRDRVLTILMSRSFEELSGPLGKESLRSEIQTQLATLVDDGEIRDVLFSEFIVQ